MAGRSLRKWLGVGLIALAVGCGGAGPMLTEDEVQQLVRAHLETKTYYVSGSSTTVIGQYGELVYIDGGYEASCARLSRIYFETRPLTAAWLPDEGAWEVALKDFGSWRVYERTLVVEAGERNPTGC